MKQRILITVLALMTPVMARAQEDSCEAVQTCVNVLEKLRENNKLYKDDLASGKKTEAEGKANLIFQQGNASASQTETNLRNILEKYSDLLNVDAKTIFKDCLDNLKSMCEIIKAGNSPHPVTVVRGKYTRGDVTVIWAKGLNLPEGQANIDVNDPNFMYYLPHWVMFASFQYNPPSVEKQQIWINIQGVDAGNTEYNFAKHPGNWDCMRADSQSELIINANVSALHSTNYIVNIFDKEGCEGGPSDTISWFLPKKNL